MGLQASNLTYGHRFMAPKALQACEPDELREVAAREGPRHGGLQRSVAKSIRAGVTAAAERLGGIAVIDDALLDEVTALVEWPVPLAGRFDAKFLELPPEVPIATMQDHQRYFPVRNAQRCADAVVRHRLEHREPRPGAGDRRQRTRRAAAAVRRGVLLQHRPAAAVSIRTLEALATRDVPDAARLAARQDRARARAGASHRGGHRRRREPGRSCRATQQVRPADRHGRRISRNCRA